MDDKEVKREARLQRMVASAVASRHRVSLAMTNRHRPIKVHTVGYIDRKSQ
jgi:hypothetical protein